MKKLTSLISTVLACSMLVPVTTNADSYDYSSAKPIDYNENYDVNGDGEITLVDSYLILGVYSEISTSQKFDTFTISVEVGTGKTNRTYEINDTIRENVAKLQSLYDDDVLSEIASKVYRYVYDIDSDGEITALDALLIQRTVAEIGTNQKFDVYYDITPEVYGNEDINYSDYEYEMTDGIRAKSTYLCKSLEYDHVDLDAAVLILTSLKDTAIAGDVNRDGIVDADDASEVLSVYSTRSIGGEVVRFTQYINIENAGDVNGDGMIDADDASAILNMYSENSTSAK